MRDDHKVNHWLGICDRPDHYTLVIFLKFHAFCCVTEICEGRSFKTARINSAKKMLYLLFWSMTPNSWEKETTSMTILENDVVVEDITNNGKCNLSLSLLNGGLTSWF